MIILSISQFTDGASVTCLGRRNIDDCIRRAELEYRLETEELNILNLQGEHLRLRSRLEGGEDEAAPPPPAASLSRWVFR